MKNNIIVVGFLLLLQSEYIVHADWIDPDTPPAAHYTRPRPGAPPKQIIEKKKKSVIEKKVDEKPSSPTQEPLPTAKPSESPTPSPSQSPTLHPTSSNANGPTFSKDQRKFKLVFSDEFNIDGRQFHDGSDPKWTALDKNDYTNGALHYYSPDNAYTENGDLIIKSEAKSTTFAGFNDTSGKDEVSTKNFKSAMLQTWNKFCFTGGIAEAEIQLPGKHDVGGLWPAFWLLGNIARHTYVGSTNHVWPWSSNVCTDKSRHAQRINGCMKAQHYGLKKGVGRGAPEIDIFEVQAGSTKANQGAFLESPVGQPFASTSFQVAPGRPDNRPAGWPGPGQWYEGLTGGVNTSLNILFHGDYNHFRGDPDEKDYWSDAISFNHQLDERHFEQKFRYRVEWELPEEDRSTDGYIRWYINDHFIMEINGTGIVDADLGSTISTEPMYIIMNTAISKEWGFPSKCPSNCPCEKYDCHSKKFAEICGFSPNFCDMMKNETGIPKYKANWVRVYQDPTNPKHKVGCSTPERPTKKYIEAHEELYKTKNDVRPLKPISVGKGSCHVGATGVSAASCGGLTRGVCSPDRVCECRPGWTGPHCLVHDGFDPVIYEREDGWQDLGFRTPRFRLGGIWVSLVVVTTTIIFLPMMRRRLDEWKPLKL